MVEKGVRQMRRRPPFGEEGEAEHRRMTGVAPEDRQGDRILPAPGRAVSVHSDFIRTSFGLHSDRRATSGSTRAARWAGRRQAMKETSARRATTAAKMSGSVGVTPNRRLA